MKKTKEHLGIKSWAEEDRPREKLLLKNKEALSVAELIGILIGSGNNGETAVDLSKRILQSVDYDLNELAKLTVKDLMKFKGIGEAKAISIIAAMELNRRRQQFGVKSKIKIQSASDVYEVFHPILSDLPHEEFWVLLLNRSNKINGRERISIGGVAGTIVDIKMIFKSAINSLSSLIILCHNHPSGNLKPSKVDIDITGKFKEAGNFLEVSVLDHVIITDSGYFSFADEGIL